MRRIVFLVSIVLGLSALVFFGWANPLNTAVAKAVASSWLSAQPNAEIVLPINDQEPRGFVSGCFFQVPSQCTPDRSGASFLYQTDTHYIGLGFDSVISPTTTKEEAQKALRYISLDKVQPLSIPGWELRARTPLSSFKDGVEILSLKDNRIKLKVTTTLSGLIGERQNYRCETPADGAAPESCHFSLDQQIPLQLTIDVPMFQSPTTE